MMRMKRLPLVCVFGGLLLRADVIAVGPGAFSSGATTVDFGGLADGTEVNGLLVNGVRFTYTAGNGAVEIDAGPGTTNHLSPPNIVSVGDNAGVLTVTLPFSTNLFGYGFAILSEDTVSNAASISVFSGTTLLDSLTFSGAPDPLFTGGFAGVQSTSAFNRVALTFNSSVTSAFALDDIKFVSAAPEPSTTLLAVLGFAALATMSRRFTSTGERP